MSSKIIPSRAIRNNSTINSSSVLPPEPMQGEMNDQKVVIDGTPTYDGSTTNTVEVTVDNEERIIYGRVIRLPATFNIEDETGNLIYFDGSEAKFLKINGYSIKELPAEENEVKRYGLFKNDITQVGPAIVVPKDTDLVQALNDEINNRIASDAELIREFTELINTKVETKEEKPNCYVSNGFNVFTFEDNTEATFTDTFYDDVNLTIPADVKQGYISMLTLDEMVINKTIRINNLSQFPTRILKGNTYYNSNECITTITGKKILFARCDGLCVEILIIEEIPSVW